MQSRNYKTILGLICAVILLWGCSTASRTNVTNVTLKEPIPSALDRSTTVAGTDANGNGVRDDIDNIISQLPLAATEKEACTKHAAILQKTLLNSSDAEKSITNTLDLIYQCATLLEQTPNASDYLDRVFAYTVNTPQRTQAYFQYYAHIRGQALRFSGTTRSADLSGCTTRSTRGTDLCKSSGYVIGYINGIRTGPIQAATSLAHLHSLVGDSFKNEDITYLLLHNRTYGDLLDLFEAYGQKLREEGVTQSLPELMWALLMGNDGIVNAIIEAQLPIFPKIREAVSKARTLVYERVQQWLAMSSTAEVDVNIMLQKLQTALIEQKKILFVAHSQGNFFANTLYERIRPTLQQNSIGVVHVATPTEVLHGPRTTSSNDRVINLVRTLVGSAPANITLAPSTSDVLGHDFDKIYLAQARGKILGDIRTTLDSLQSPNTQGTAGFFTVTLTWNGSGDVDLHVIEPDSTHVYYGAKQGSSGFLDIDNTFANGPEHFYASCDSSVLKTGIYQVGINNYRAATGRTATVVLSTPDRIYPPVSLSVGPERGNSGNNAPLSVFSVLVEKDSNGRYSAKRIEGRSRVIPTTSKATDPKAASR